MTSRALEIFGRRLYLTNKLEGPWKCGSTVDLPSVEHKTRTFAALQEMLRWFAGSQIRNVAVSMLGFAASSSATFTVLCLQS